MAINVELRDAELAEHLAHTLSDFEFEMLVRKRIEATYQTVISCTRSVREIEFEESYATCEFTYKWDDKCNWHVRVGTNYKDAVYGDGEVLSVTWHNAVNHFMNQRENKLSLLLPAPKPTLFE